MMLWYVLVFFLAGHPGRIPYRTPYECQAALTAAQANHAVPLTGLACRVEWGPQHDD